MIRPKVAIMLCTYNGEEFLEQQLLTISKQSFRDFTLIASDDGSTDTTRAILDRTASGNLHGRMRIVEGPKLGVNANFLSIAAMNDCPADYIAYADQDDLWDTDKLERAIAWLDKTDPARPALYGTRTRLIDRHGAPMGNSPLFKKEGGFSNALVQNLFGGNTMVFNEATWRVLKASSPIDVVSHDWWTYIAVAAVNGQLRYDPQPSLSYRQHGGNLVGANTSWSARVKRLKMVRSGRFAQWNRTNARALRPLFTRMPPEQRRTFLAFQKARRSRFPANVAWLARSGVYRQTALATLGLWLATATRRI